MMRRLPNKLDLGLALIHIRLVAKGEMREEAECEEDDPTPEGLWADDEDTIFVGKWLSAKRKREVLFHELIHAAIDLREHVGDTYETDF